MSGVLDPADLVLRQHQRMSLNGLVHHLAQNMAIARAGDPGEIPGIQLTMHLGAIALFANFTPEGARAVANKLLAAAAEIDALSAQHLRDALCGKDGAS